MDIAARIARKLEAGGDASGMSGALAALASHAWSHVASSRVARPLRFQDASRVIAVGGATLGGSGKTPLAIACAAALASRGRAVALVGHAYRASLRRADGARVVHPEDDATVVGDEAIVAARALAEWPHAVVMVAKARQVALDAALAAAGRVALIDGVVQATPRRVGIALLAVDAEKPWGPGACPPLGDLRAPSAALLEATDHVIAVTDPLATSIPFVTDRPVSSARILSAGARFLDGQRDQGELVAWPALAALRVGLVTSLARPGRVRALLARRGVVPAVVLSAGDHRDPSAELLACARAHRVDLWLASAKCALHFGAPTAALGAPLAVLDYELELDPKLLEALFALTSLRSA